MFLFLDVVILGIATSTISFCPSSQYPGCSPSPVCVFLSGTQQLCGVILRHLDVQTSSPNYHAPCLCAVIQSCFSSHWWDFLTSTTCLFGGDTCRAIPWYWSSSPGSCCLKYSLSNSSLGGSFLMCSDPSCFIFGRGLKLVWNELFFLQPHVAKALSVLLILCSSRIPIWVADPEASL